LKLKPDSRWSGGGLNTPFFLRANIIGDPHKVAPWLRTPGFGRSPAIEQPLAARFAAADRLRRIKPVQRVERAMARRNQSGKGIVALHDT
jgi:hypothetical protein